MYDNKILIHPKKVVKEMNKFTNSIITNKYATYSLEEGIVEHSYTCKMIKGNQFGIRYAGIDGTRYEMTYSFSNAYEEDILADRTFRKDFVNRCPLARGFADITLTILHELGHMHSEQPFNYSEYIHAQILIGKTANNIVEANEMYFKIPNEENATNWAIEWLQDPENRKLAKAFEKEFFKCFI